MPIEPESPPQRLVQWFRQNARELPWRETEDPYRIWISEIMLQQTRVNTVIDYYHRFLQEFPTVEDLADATRDDVLKLWEGLGYYARARWLHDAARTVVEAYHGNVPRNPEDRKQLKGIGDYTSAAIGAFAYNQSEPVIDGNVLRVMTRIEGIEEPVDRADTKARVKNLLHGWLEDTEQPGTLSEAVMELGALVCTPDNPDCGSCPINGICEAYEDNLQARIPATGDSPDRPHHEVVAGVIEDDEKILISRRPEEGMLGGLWEFPGGKQENGESLQQALVRELQEELGIHVNVGEKLETIPHGYSHMTINLHAYRCSIKTGEPKAREGQQWKWIRPSQLPEFALPKSNHPIMEQLIG